MQSVPLPRCYCSCSLTNPEKLTTVSSNDFPACLRFEPRLCRNLTAKHPSTQLAISLHSPELCAVLKFPELPIGLIALVCLNSPLSSECSHIELDVTSTGLGGQYVLF